MADWSRRAFGTSEPSTSTLSTLMNFPAALPELPTILTQWYPAATSPVDQAIFW